MHPTFERKHPDGLFSSPFFTMPHGVIQPSSPLGNEGRGAMVKRTVIVFRVSNNKSTTENQAYAMEKHIRGLGYIPTIRSFIASSWKKPIKEMTQLEDEIKQDMWDEIHLWRVDRTGRNHHFDVNLWELCKRKGVLLWYIDEDFKSNREDDEDHFHEASLQGAKERKLISKRTKIGIARLREACRRTGQPDPFKGKRQGCRSQKVIDQISTVLDLLRLGYGAKRIGKQLHINPSTVRSIRDTPIAELRCQTGMPKLRPWH